MRNCHELQIKTLKIKWKSQKCILKIFLRLFHEVYMFYSLFTEHWDHMKCASSEQNLIALLSFFWKNAIKLKCNRKVISIH